MGNREVLERLGSTAEEEIFGRIERNIWKTWGLANGIKRVLDFVNCCTAYVAKNLRSFKPFRSLGIPRQGKK